MKQSEIIQNWLDAKIGKVEYENDYESLRRVPGGLIYQGENEVGTDGITLSTTLIPISEILRDLEYQKVREQEGK